MLNGSSAQIEQVTTLSTSARPRDEAPMGVDIGNGSLKLVTGMGETRIDSYIHYLPERASMTTNSGYVEYQGGDRTDLVGKQWIAGVNAYYQGIRTIDRVTDTNEGKINLGLQLLLGGLSELAYRSEWNLLLTCSIHDGKILGKGLKKALEGSHKVLLRGKESKVTISVSAVLEEGTGAVLHYLKDCDMTNALIYDLGNGTLIVSSFSGLSLADRRYSQNGGVESLIDAVATNHLIRTKLLKEGDRHLIRTGIESAKFGYGTQFPGWDFSASYKEELPNWVERVLKPMVRPTEDRAVSATALLAIGGGACMPGIRELLAKRNIQVLKDPQWANARGLYAYALRKSSGL